MRHLKIIYLYLVILITANTAVMCQDYAESSVLSSGTWLKLNLETDGIVKIRYEQLEALGLPEGIVPAVYGNNFGLLSYMNNEPSPDDLEPMATYIEKGTDNIFNSGDYILFLAKSTHRWQWDLIEGYQFKRHNYSDSPVYFLTWSLPSLQIIVKEGLAAVNNSTEFFDHIYIHEIEKDNIIKSGREWYEPVVSTHDVSFSDYQIPGNYESGDVVKYKLRVFARSDVMTSFRLNSGVNMIASIPVSEVDINSSTGTYAREAILQDEYDPIVNSEPLTLSYFNNGNNSARAWLDYLLVHERKKISYLGEPIYIRDHKSIEAGQITEFLIDSDSDKLLVWDITDGDNPVELETSYSAGILSFISDTDTLRTFIVFDPDLAFSPSNIESPIPNQNLHAQGEYDGIIVTHNDFRLKADQLAEIHLQNDGLISKVVTTEEIYNEFSGGIQDISAIRNYVRMVYLRNKESEKPLKYLTLFGDGSYENRSQAPDNPNFVPTYQTQNSNINIQSFTSDDYYGLLDDDEGEAMGYIDIGIGRLPVTDTIEANTILMKIMNYIDPENMGSWRNMILMIADDEDSNTHLNDAEALASYIETEKPNLNIDKVYFDSYDQLTSINGDSYPDATVAISNRIKAGCLIFNYLGHGNELGLAHERVVKIDDINSWTNINKLPVFITATCEFSRFDDIDINPGTGDISQKSSAGELVLLSDQGGGIALLTTTRIVYSAPNYILNNRIYRHAFTLDANGNGLALGDIIRLAKNDAGSGDNKRNFTLLGDPALKLAYPWYGKVHTDSINGVDVSVFNDTIKALSELRISGHISDNSDNEDNDFNGLINTVIYDKQYNEITLANDGGSPVSFDKQDRSLFRGTAIVENGKFELKLLIPRHIDYTFGTGKISYYANSETSDNSGSFNDIIIGGFNDQNISDTIGPVIRLFMNDTLFRSGGITDKNPVLLALISDDGGINASGLGIGHDIVSNLDQDISSSTILNSFFENNINSYTSGYIEYPLGELQKGEHSLSLKAWDNYNNSTSESIIFFVETKEGFILNRLLNYPNPFSANTSFNLGHNRPETEMNIEIIIYNSGGSMIKRIRTIQTSGGYSLKPIVWNGCNDSGSKVGRGVYIYTVTISTSEGERARISGRMVIL